MNALFRPFNPNPVVQVQPLGQGRICVVIDNVLADAGRIVEFAKAHRSDFIVAPFNAYPGVELKLGAEFSQRLAGYFDVHVRRLLGGLKTLRMNCRLSMATLKPGELEPRQWLCHCDKAGMDPAHGIAASVLYLFNDPGLGGTLFFAPKKPAGEINLLVHDSSTMQRDAFARKYPGIAQGYLVTSNEYYEVIGHVEAKWNRMVFYDGAMFHTGKIDAPSKLTDDPATGRLTLNGFFTCSRS